MSLGNVSLPRVAEEHFAQAVRYLRQARDVAGFVLAPYLQQYVIDHQLSSSAVLTGSVYLGTWMSTEGWSTDSAE